MWPKTMKITQITCSWTLVEKWPGNFHAFDELFIFIHKTTCRLSNLTKCGLCGVSKWRLWHGSL